MLGVDLSVLQPVRPGELISYPSVAAVPLLENWLLVFKLNQHLHRENNFAQPAHNYSAVVQFFLLRFFVALGRLPIDDNSACRAIKDTSLDVDFLAADLRYLIVEDVASLYNLIEEPVQVLA